MKETHGLVSAKVFDSKIRGVFSMPFKNDIVNDTIQ
jgi:hypothetical protein